MTANGYTRLAFSLLLRACEDAKSPEILPAVDALLFWLDDVSGYKVYFDALDFAPSGEVFDYVYKNTGTTVRRSGTHNKKHD